MAAELDRLELFVDGDQAPRRVVDAPPFEASLDSTELADGDHKLRIVGVRKDGRRMVRTIPFRVNNVPHFTVEGLEENAVVEGKVDLTVLVDGEAPTARKHSVVRHYVAPSVVVLGLVWAFFALVAPPLGAAAPATAGENGSGVAQASSSEAKVSSRVMARGKSLFDTNCATCHQQTGKGVPGAFPPLALNKNLKSVELIVDTIHSGHSGKITVEGRRFDSAMPAIGAGFSSDQIAEVATYIRNAWGNHDGPVSESQVSEILSKAARPGQ